MEVSAIANRFAACRRIAWGIWLFGVVPAAGQAVELPEMVVLADRQTGEEMVVPIAEWSQKDLRAYAPRTIDEVLDQEPSFSLYRRQTAIFANPTAAGVSLRNTGATAASRTLVLLDGIPQNDPFGGWIYWARYDAAALDSIRIIPSAQAAVWGNQSPAGVVQMNGYAPFENRHVVKAGAGGQDTISGSMVHQMTNPEKSRAVSFSAFGLKSGGFYALAPSQRGPIDRKLDVSLWGADVKFAWLAAPGLTVEPMVSYYSEDRGNGTPLSRNSTDALDLALRVTSETGDFPWQVIAWHQERNFESVFSSVGEDRVSETMALDQFDVPGSGTGGAFTLRCEDGDRWDLSAGADTRFLSGETNEDAGTFRRREAGGDQAFAGVFGAAAYRLDEETRLNLSGRLDYWQLTDGRRLETSLSTGKPLRTDEQPDRDGFEPSAAVEIARDLRDDLAAHLSAGTGFRLPTLNELHRPFRVRNDIVEANPALDPERFFSIEGGLDWQPLDGLDVSASVYHHWISDAVANVPVTDPDEISEIFGSVPSGGSVSQKRNVEEAQVTGIEGKIEWSPRDALRLGITGLWSDTRFIDSPDQPLLEGKPFPQAPDLRLVASGDWQATEQLALFAAFEYGASQFDDALASRVIPDYTSVRIGLSWRTESAIYQIRVDNVFNEEIVTGVSSDGIRTLAAPRSLWVGAEWEF